MEQALVGVLEVVGGDGCSVAPACARVQVERPDTAVRRAFPPIRRAWNQTVVLVEHTQPFEQKGAAQRFVECDACIQTGRFTG